MRETFNPVFPNLTLSTVTSEGTAIRMLASPVRAKDKPAHSGNSCLNKFASVHLYTFLGNTFFNIK